MAFHLEDHALSVTDIDDASIFPRPLNDQRSLCRQFFQPNTRRLVGAVLGPHDRDDAKFGEVGSAAKQLTRPAKFVGRHAMSRGKFFGCDRRSFFVQSGHPFVF